LADADIQSIARSSFLTIPRLMLRVRSLLGLLIASSMLSLGACGSDAATAPIPTIETTTYAAALGVDLAASTKTTSGLYYRDIVVGTGAAVANGQTVSVHYTGWLTNGTQFDANGPTATPFSFVLGTGNVITGWHIGVAGMRIGGQRQLLIPPSLGYGAQGSGPIPGNAILVFNITVVSAK
jgi:FKBP-type peptidyl-prolyl cis-trans isomerase FkpA